MTGLAKILANTVILSEVKNLMPLERYEILRFAQNDRDCQKHCHTPSDRAGHGTLFTTHLWYFADPSVERFEQEIVDFNRRSLLEEASNRITPRRFSTIPSTPANAPRRIRTRWPMPSLDPRKQA